MRNTLVTALVSCADQTVRVKARRFLKGLSSDELQFIAGFLGACILEEDHPGEPSQVRLAESIAHVQREDGSSSAATYDRDHKMILLREYLSRAGCSKQPVGRAARHAAII